MPDTHTEDWYKIPEIPKKKYIELLEPIYNVLEGKLQARGSDDPFLKTILASRSGMTIEEWDLAESQRRFHKALSMKLGTFHQGILASFENNTNLHQGGEYGLDVLSSENEIWEIKNRENTMNSDSAKSVIRKLINAFKSGKKACLGFVNCGLRKVPRFGAPSEILVLAGDDLYNHFSKRVGFREDLRITIAETFKQFKTYDELKKGMI
jgi:hypothetical protein